MADSWLDERGAGGGRRDPGTLRRAGELAGVFPLQGLEAAGRIARRREAPAEAHPIMDRQVRGLEERPALAEVGGIRLDERDLDGCPRAARDHRDAAGQGVDGMA